MILLPTEKSRYEDLLPPTSQPSLLFAFLMKPPGSIDRPISLSPAAPRLFSRLSCKRVNWRPTHFCFVFFYFIFPHQHHAVRLCFSSSAPFPAFGGYMSTCTSSAYIVTALGYLSLISGVPESRDRVNCNVQRQCLCKHTKSDGKVDLVHVVPVGLIVALTHLGHSHFRFLPLCYRHPQV